MIHPSKAIMQEIINDQWEKNDSITAAVVDAGGTIVAKGITTVGIDHDPTAHAEVNALRAACKKLGVSEFPKGYYLYSTFEPCPLCTAAAIWAKIDGIVYANNPEFRGKEDNWSFITCEKMLEHGEYIHHVELTKNFMIDSIKEYFVSGKR